MHRDLHRLSRERGDVDVAQLELTDLREPQAGHRGHGYLKQQFALLTGVEVAELDHEATLDRGRRKVVQQLNLITAPDGRTVRCAACTDCSSRSSTSDATAAPASSPCSAKRVFPPPPRATVAIKASSYPSPIPMVEVVTSRWRAPGREGRQLIVIGDAPIRESIGEQQQRRRSLVPDAADLL